MIKLGVTGGIGSGKSMVCKVFQILGFPVYNSDIRARLLMNEHPDIKKELIDKYGSLLYKSGQLDRKKLGAIIFSNPKERDFVNRIVHPVVRNDFNEFCGYHAHYKMIIQEAAIMFESGAYKFLDEIVAVACPENIRIRRVSERDNRPVKEIMDIIHSQMSEEERNRRADFIIYNDESEFITAQVLKIKNSLLKNN